MQRRGGLYDRGAHVAEARPHDELLHCLLKLAPRRLADKRRRAGRAAEVANALVHRYKRVVKAFSDDGYQITLVGHSLGGGTAALAAMQLHRCVSCVGG